MSASNLFTETQCLAEDAAALFAKIEKLSDKAKRLRDGDKQEPESVQVTKKKRMHACVVTTTFEFMKDDVDKILRELVNKFVPEDKDDSELEGWEFDDEDQFFYEMAPDGVISDGLATLITRELLGSIPPEESKEWKDMLPGFKKKFNSMKLV